MSANASNVPDYAKHARRTPSLVWPVLALCGAALIVAALWWRTRADRAVPPTPVAIAPASAMETAVVETEPLVDVEALYANDIVPLLNESLKRKQDAAGRALAILDKRLDGHRKGIPAFASDVTSWGPRFGVVGRSTRDAYRKA